MAKKTILFIEDEDVLVKNITLLLEDRYKIESAAEGEEGITKAKKIKPDLILLDIILPDMNGVEVLQQLRHQKETEDIPVLVLTNLSDPETIGDILKAGGTDYMVKADYSLDEVGAKIESIIN